MSDQLYELLTKEKTAEIPWAKAAEHFVMLKLASGALLPEEVDQIKIAAQVEQEQEKTAQREYSSRPRLAPAQIDELRRRIAREKLRGEVRESKKKGILSGLRSSVSQDISHASRVRRKRGENIGKMLGALGGAGAGLLAAKKGKLTSGSTVGAAALASALGLGTGKVVGSEIDRRRVKARYRPKKKAAEIEKTSALGAGLVVKERKGKVVDPNISVGIPYGVAANVAPAKGLRIGSVEIRPSIGVGLSGPMFGIQVKKVEKGKEKTSAMKEKQDGEATAIPVQDGVGSTPVDEFLSAQQEANELEFFRQQADEAQQVAADASERAEMAEQKVQELGQQQQVEQQNQQVQQQAAQQGMVAAQQQAQIAQQDSVQARDESLSAQQANIALRQTITSYRQALMNLVAQDPTQQVPPAPVPQGPMPGMAPGGAPPGAPPGAEGGPPGAEGAPVEGAPPDQGAMPPGAPPAGPPAGPPMGPPGPGGMGGAAPTPNVKPPGGAQGGPPKPPGPTSPPAA
jgi:hypothetical protein